MNYEAEDLRLANQYKGTQDGARIGETDSDKWEVETDTTLDNLYHSWLGEKKRGGVWVRDPHLKKMMNEKGASYLISEIKSRFNANMHFSVLEDEDIRDIVSDAVNSINANLTRYYREYELDSSTSINSVIHQVFNSLYIFLKISWKGGMRMYKGDKTKTVITKQEQTVNENGAF